MSKKSAPDECAESASQAVYDLRDCIPASEERLWKYLDELATWLTVLGRRFEDCDSLLSEPPAGPPLPVERPAKRDGILALLEFAADCVLTPEEAEQELLESGVDVVGFLARVKQRREAFKTQPEPVEVKQRCTHCGGSGDGPDEIAHGNEVVQRPCEHCRGTGAEP